MTLLLDTHAFLWFCQDDPLLSTTAKALIEDAGNRRDGQLPRTLPQNLRGTWAGRSRAETGTLTPGSRLPRRSSAFGCRSRCGITMRSPGETARFNRIFNRLYAPHEWFVDAGKLVFMEENQAVVVWGTTASPEPEDDPPVYQGVKGQPIEWYVEHEHLPVFLVVMLHWQGAFGGAMRRCGTAVVHPNLLGRLDRDWPFVGEVNQMRPTAGRGRRSASFAGRTGGESSRGRTPRAASPPSRRSSAYIGSDRRPSDGN